MSSILDDARDERQKRGPRGCVELALSQHPDQTRLILEAVWGYRRPDVEAAALARSFARRGIRLTSEMIRRHVRGICSCDPTLTGEPEGSARR